ncbi:MAG: hypothetical protein ACJATE_001974 [Bacteroidia bacterium]
MTLAGSAGGTYSSTAGLNFNGTAGEVNLATSVTGTYTVTYIFTDGNGCPGSTTTAVTINAQPTAAISYAGDPYCAIGIAPVTLTGAVGGTFSSTAGLNFNGTAGEINLTTSTTGTYTVTYTFTNGNGCSISPTTAVTINAIPSVTVSADFVVCADPIASQGGFLGGASVGGSATQGQWTSSAAPATTVTFSNTGFVSDPSVVDVSVPAAYIGDLSLTLTSNDPFGCGAASESFVVSVVGSQAATTWTGAANNNWHDFENWSNCIPGSTTATTIAATANNPRITAADADCFNIEVQHGAQVEITGSLQLNVYE